MKLLKLSLLLGAVSLIATPGQAKEKLKGQSKDSFISCPGKVDFKLLGNTWKATGATTMNDEFTGEVPDQGKHKPVVTPGSKTDLKAGQNFQKPYLEYNLFCIYHLVSPYQTLVISKPVKEKCTVEEDVVFVCEGNEKPKK